MSVSLDKIDREILIRLQKNARKSFAEIAREIGVSEATVHIRVKRLRKNGVIRGFYTILAPEKIGERLTVFILLKSVPSEYENVLKEIIKIPKVYEVHDVTGEYYAIIKARVRDKEELAQLLDKLGAIKGVTSTETLLVLRTLKEEYTIPL